MGKVYRETIPKIVDAWRYLPHTYAMKMSGGRWRPFKYLVTLSHLLTNAVALGNGRILVSIPPRHGKSFFISHYFPAWFLSNWPDKRVILSTYEANFAAKWGGKVRNTVRDFGVEISDDSSAAHRWSTTLGGGMLTAGVGGPVTGEGGDILIVDDPHKNWAEASSPTIRAGIQDWFNSTFYTRCEPGATIIILHTRWNEDDLIGYCQEEHEDEWIQYRLPAICEDEDDLMGRQIGEALCPERYDVQALHKMERAVGPMVWAGLYQQRPAPMEGNIFKKDWWRRYDIRPAFDVLIQSWDTGYSKKEGASYSVCLTWGRVENDFYLVDVFRDRLKYPDLEQQVFYQYAKHNPNVVLIENKASGQSLIQTFMATLPIIAVDPIVDKVVRAMAVSSLVKEGHCYVPKWADQYILNLAVFPNGKYTDEVDATSQALAFLRSMGMGGQIARGVPRIMQQLIQGYR